jgi:hypothetical protein
MKTRDLFFLTKSGLALNCVTLIVVITGCTAPKSITESGKTTPRGQLKVGANYNANIPTQTIKNAIELVGNGIGTVKSIKAINNEQEAGEEIKNRAASLSKYAIGYAVDPMTYGINYYARLGIAKRVDIGYQYAGGTNAFDIKYQFLGTTGKIGSYSENRFYGSIGLQYSSRKYELPDKFKMMDEFIDFRFNRKDLFIPVIFSKSFGDEEKKGHFSWGVAYNRAFLEYGMQNKVYQNADLNIPYQNIERKQFSSYGTFINLKTGNRCVFFVMSLAVYYTDYGTYKLIDGSSAHLHGFTYVPSLGIQFVTPGFRKK